MLHFQAKRHTHYHFKGTPFEDLYYELPNYYSAKITTIWLLEMNFHNRQNLKRVVDIIVQKNRLNPSLLNPNKISCNVQHGCVDHYIRDVLNTHFLPLIDCDLGTCDAKKLRL